MTEKRLKQMWWWRDKQGSWAEIAKTIWGNSINPGHVDAEGSKAWCAWIEWERAAFVHEVHGRLRSWANASTPDWEFNRPFVQLQTREMVVLKNKYPSKAWRLGSLNQHSTGQARVDANKKYPSLHISIDFHRPGSISLDGLDFEPSSMTPRSFQKLILATVEERMKIEGLKWSSSALKGYRDPKVTPYPWGTIEDIDRLYSGLPCRQQYNDPEKAAYMLKTRYGVIER